MKNKENIEVKKISENLDKLMAHHFLSFEDLSKAITGPHLSRLTKRDYLSVISEKNKENGKVKKISENLDKLISHHSLSFRGVSRATGIAQPHLSRLSKKEHASPGLDVLEKISNFFEINIAQLIGEQEIDFDKLPKLTEVLEKISHFFGITVAQLTGEEKINFNNLPKLNSTKEGKPEEIKELPNSDDDAIEEPYPETPSFGP
ncbi:MAG: S24 family peptidase [uncultured bacterium]|nr:MAG: S24 family peptidase [uncultured bacterium]